MLSSLFGFKQMQALSAMRRSMDELRHHVPGSDVQRGKDVTLYQPFALKNKYEVVIPAPQPNPTEVFLDREEEYQESLKDKAS